MSSMTDRCTSIAPPEAPKTSRGSVQPPAILILSDSLEDNGRSESPGYRSFRPRGGSFERRRCRTGDILLRPPPRRAGSRSHTIVSLFKRNNQLPPRMFGSEVIRWSKAGGSYRGVHDESNHSKAHREILLCHPRMHCRPQEFPSLAVSCERTLSMHVRRSCKPLCVTMIMLNCGGISFNHLVETDEFREPEN